MADEPDDWRKSLSREDWRMARQAGAPLDITHANIEEGRYGDQLVFDGLGPAAGTQYRNIHSGYLATVVRVQQRRRRWVVLRIDNRETEIPAEWLDEHYEPA